MALAWACVTGPLRPATCFCACATEAVEPRTSELLLVMLVLTLTLVMGTLTVAWTYWAWALARLAWACSSGDLVVAGIDLGERVACLHGLVILNVDLDDLAAIRELTW